MKILLTNDDGLESEGLQMLCRRLADCGHEVYVVAPDGNRSATSHCANFYKRIFIRLRRDYCGAVEAYACTGSPADCVKFAESVLKINFDLLVSGPNNGENTGNAILYSGTIGAAEEGVLCGYHSIALSRLGRDGDFAPAVNFFVRNLQALSAVRIPDAFLNVNVPECAEKDIRGVRVVRQSEGKLYHDYMEKQPDDEDCWVSTGFRAELTEKDANTDVIMSEQGYVTITPLTVVRTCFDALDKIKFLEKLS